MSLITNENSYVTLDEANDIVNKSFLSNSSERQYWDGLTDDDKEILILNQMDKIENIKWLGFKRDSKQKLNWPRVIHQINYECPWSIKKGIVLQMIQDSLEESTSEYKLKEMGVKSFADGGGGRIEFANSSDNISSISKNKLGISEIIWTKYFKEWSILI